MQHRWSRPNHVSTLTYASPNTKKNTKRPSPLPRLPGCVPRKVQNETQTSIFLTFPMLQTTDRPNSRLGPATAFFFKCTTSAAFPFPCRIANRSKTSIHVMHILMTMRAMMIHVMRVIFLSLMLSERISPRSRKTRHLSLSTWIRGFISRYSRTAVYSGWSVGSESQKNLGVSSIFDATRS
jgi:hypothetical protein